MASCLTEALGVLRGACRDADRKPLANDAKVVRRTKTLDVHAWKPKVQSPLREACLRRPTVILTALLRTVYLVAKYSYYVGNEYPEPPSGVLIS